MKPLISMRAYVSDDMLRSECCLFFPARCVCVGSPRQVTHDNDFLKFSDGLYSVVVQNLGGALRVLTNVSVQLESVVHVNRAIFTEDYIVREQLRMGDRIATTSDLMSDESLRVAKFDCDHARVLPVADPVSCEWR